MLPGCKEGLVSARPLERLADDGKGCLSVS